MFIKFLFMGIKIVNTLKGVKMKEERVISTIS